MGGADSHIDGRNLIFGLKDCEVELPLVGVQVIALIGRRTDRVVSLNPQAGLEFTHRRTLHGPQQDGSSTVPQSETKRRDPILEVVGKIVPYVLITGVHGSHVHLGEMRPTPRELRADYIRQSFDRTVGHRHRRADGDRIGHNLQAGQLVFASELGQDLLEQILVGDGVEPDVGAVDLGQIDANFRIVDSGAPGRQLSQMAAEARKLVVHIAEERLVVKCHYDIYLIEQRVAVAFGEADSVVAMLAH